MEKVLSVNSHSLTILQFQQEVHTNHSHVPHTSSEIKLFEKSTQAPMGHQENGAPLIFVFFKEVLFWILLAGFFIIFMVLLSPTDGEDISLGALSNSQSETSPTTSC